MIRPAAEWKPAGSFEDILYEKCDGIAKVTINRPEVRNAFRPQTVLEMQRAFADVREDASIGAAILSSFILAAAHRRASPSEQALEEQEDDELFAEDLPEVVASA